MILANYQVLYSFLICLNLLFLFWVLVYYFNTVNKNISLLKGDLEGTWERRGQDADGKDWWFSYHFKKGTFNMSGEPTFSCQGKYRILKEVEQQVIVELKKTAGDPLFEGNHLRIGVDRKGKRLNINGRDFSKVS